MGHDKSHDQASMDRTSQAQGLEHGQDLNKGRDDSMTGGRNDQTQRDMQQGDLTRPAQPSGTAPLDKDEQAINKTRPVQQNR